MRRQPHRTTEPTRGIPRCSGHERRFELPCLGGAGSSYNPISVSGPIRLYVHRRPLSLLCTAVFLSPSCTPPQEHLTTALLFSVCIMFPSSFCTLQIPLYHMLLHASKTCPLLRICKEKEVPYRFADPVHMQHRDRLHSFFASDPRLLSHKVEGHVRCEGVQRRLSCSSVGKTGEYGSAVPWNTS